MKKVRINKKYGEWYYEKQVDLEDKNNYVYSLYGTDETGESWMFSVIPSYSELISIIKSAKEEKIMYLNY